MTAIIIWILAAVGLAQAILAARAYLLERREGLPRSSLRLGVSVGLAVGLVALGAFEELQRPPSAAVSSRPAHVEHDAATQAKITALRGKIAELSTELEKQRTELESLDPSAGPSEELPVVAPSQPPSWPLPVAVALVLAGVGA